jgi:hypothetical protein
MMIAISPEKSRFWMEPDRNAALLMDIDRFGGVVIVFHKSTSDYLYNRTATQPGRES